jgi:RNA polymerase sigma factor (sigma-70 family)
MIDRGANNPVQIVAGAAPAKQGTPITAMPLNQMVEYYGAAVRQLLARLGLERCDADDIMQRVWLTASHCSHRIHRGAERAFLLTVARREASHVRRSQRRRSEVAYAELDDFASAAPDGDEWVERRQRLEQVSAILDEMDDGLRAVLLLFQVSEASAREVAGLLDIPVGTAKSRLRRARADYSGRVAARSVGAGAAGVSSRQRSQRLGGTSNGDCLSGRCSRMSR